MPIWKKPLNKLVEMELIPLDCQGEQYQVMLSEYQKDPRKSMNCIMQTF